MELPNDSETFYSMDRGPQQKNDELIGFDISGSIMAVCSDSSRHGAAIYSDASLQLLADRKDPGDPYRGLDIVIDTCAPEVVIVSEVQTKLIKFLEKRFSFKILDLGRKKNRYKSKEDETHKLAIELGEMSGERSTTQHGSGLTQSKKPHLESHLSSNQEEGEQAVAEYGMLSNQHIHSDSGVPSDGSEAAFTLALVPNFWFTISRGNQKLAESEFVSCTGLEDPQERALLVATKVDKADVCAIRAISAIENFLIHSSSEPNSIATYQNSQATTRRCSTAQTEPSKNQQSEVDNFNVMPILNLSYRDLGPILSIDKATLRSLNIFPRYESSRRPEGPTVDPDGSSVVSLYELLNQCQSTQGKKYLKTMMMWPLQDMDELRHRHDVIDYFLQPENRLFRDQLSIQLKNVVPLAGFLSKMIHAVGSHQDFATVYKSLWAFVAVIDLIRTNDSHGLHLLHRITAQDSEHLRKTVDSIINVIDFENSKLKGRVQVLPGIDQNVDEKQELANNLSKFCDKVAIEETTKYRDTLGKIFKVIYVPRIGFLDSVEYSTIPELQRICSNKEFDVLLHTENSVYFKTRRMEDLDNNAGDVACDLIDLQENVIMDLQKDLLKHTEAMLNLVELCGELDCLLSFSQVSFQRGYVRPTFISSEDELDLQEVYHPLYSAQCNMKPNDVRFFKSNSQRSVRVMIITGPNSCGKSTYMKATCLAIYMAHIGCFVPAIEAKIPIFDAIMTRIHSPNSISTGLSSFATDLHQINYALSRATAKSFIAIDEFGKGTQARDGFHLLKGLVTYFCARGRSSPYVMIATHFNRLINHMVNYSEYISYKTFRVHKDRANGSVVYEYRIMEGVSEESFADRVAMRAGVTPSVIERANQIRDFITEGRALRARPPRAA